MTFEIRRLVEEDVVRRELEDFLSLERNDPDMPLRGVQGLLNAWPEDVIANLPIPDRRHESLKDRPRETPSFLPGARLRRRPARLRQREAPPLRSVEPRPRSHRAQSPASSLHAPWRTASGSNRRVEPAGARPARRERRPRARADPRTLTLREHLRARDRTVRRSLAGCSQVPGLSSCHARELNVSLVNGVSVLVDQRRRPVAVGNNGCRPRP